MDYDSSISQIDQHSTDDFLQPQAIQQDKDLLRMPSEDCSGLANKTQNSQRRKSSMAFGVKDESPDDGKKRKIIHRDTERQRRQEMAALYRSLRSLLPLEYLEGKRSTYDQIQGAVNYIKHLEHKIQVFGDKRDELKKLSISPTSSSSFAMETLESCENPDTLKVDRCLLGVEVVINTAYNKAFPLSRAIEVMVEEGLSVLSCISRKANERMLHIIKLEVNEGRSINVIELQHKLTNSTISAEN